MSIDNKSLGKFMLDGIPPAPRGMPQVEVTFDVDASGILTVKAKEKTTGKEQSIRIEGSTGLSKEDIEKMKNDAEAHASEDEKRKELVEAKNVAEQTVYAAEKGLKDAGDKASEEIKTEVNGKVEEVKKAQASDDLTAIKTATEALSSSLSKVGEAMIKAQEEASKQTPSEGDQKPPEEPTDAEFKEKE